MKTAAILLAIFFVTGWFFFRMLAYIEGKPVLNRRLRWVLILPLGCGISALAVFTLRVAAGYQAHPLGETACGLVFAALAACAVSALGMMKKQAFRRTFQELGAPAQMFSLEKQAAPFKEPCEDLLCVSRKIQDIGA